jgi:8-oxo-dGTP pyrophosphatase MutT (NUDIX family)
MIHEYVLGFVFTHDLKKVLLILKNRPEWQAGNVNGIGGRMEPEDPSIKMAMFREAREEADLHSQSYMIGWEHYMDMEGEIHKIDHWLVHCFYAVLNKDVEPKTMTDEYVGLYEIDNLPTNRVPHLMMNVRMALLAIDQPTFSKIRFL